VSEAVTVTSAGQSQYVLSGTMSIPRIGAWVIDVTTREQLASGAVAINDGERDWQGFCTKSTGGVSAVFTARIVGGSGNLTAELGPAHWQSTTLGAVLASTLTDGGERLSGLIQPAVQAVPLPFWTRTTGTLGAAVAALAGVAGSDWRVLQDGSVWLGTGRPTPANPFDAEPLLIDTDLAVGLIVLSPESFSTIPGDLISGLEVQSVRYELNSTLRAWAYVEPA